MIDFHTHILPDIDDGSSSVEESVRMIEILCSQGVKQIVLTPHFYAYRSSVEGFCKNRESALKKLISELKNNDIAVELYAGCEVLFFEELWRVENIRDFCIKGTDCILIEMPFSSWENSTVEKIINLFNKGFIPVLAHFERYLRYKGNAKRINELINSGVLLQMNCDYLNKFSTRGKALKFIKKGIVFALGSDCHNISDRKPNYEIAGQLLKKKLDKRVYEKFIKRQASVIGRAKKVYPE